MSGFINNGGGGGGGSPTGPAGGNLGGTYPNPTVIQINSASVPSGGALTTGNILQVSGASALSYAPLNLGGGANFITGTLPAGNQASQTLAGDATGNTGASVVAKINGSTVPAGGALTTGNVLQVTGIGALSYSAVNLGGGANFVTGVLPAGNQANQTLTGDVTGNTGATVVSAISGSTPISIIPVTLQWATATTAPTLKQADNVTNSATATTLTIQAQNATGTSAIGGNLNLRAGTGTNIPGTIDGYAGATQVLQLGLAGTDFVAFGTTPAATGFIRSTQAAAGVTKIGVSKNTGSTDVCWAGHWHVGPGDNRFALGPGADTAGGAAIVCVGNSTMNLQATSQIGFTNSSGVPVFIINPSQIGGAVVLAPDSTATSVTLKQTDKATNAGTGANVTIQGQNETGTTSTGGNAILQSGSGTTTNGQVQFKVAATTVGQLGIAAGDFIAMGASPAAAGFVRFPNNTTGVSFRNAANNADNFTIANTSSNSGVIQSTAAINIESGTSFNLYGNSAIIGDAGFNSRLLLNSINTLGVVMQSPSTQTSFAINFADTATNSATGGTMTITAQNATGTTTAGGNVVIQSGTGTSTTGLVQLKAGATTVGQLGVAAGDFMQFGATPSISGAIRLGNAMPITAHQSSSGQVSLATLDASNQASFGDASAVNLIFTSAGGSFFRGTSANLQTANGSATIWAFTTVSAGAGTLTADTSLTSVKLFQADKVTNSGTAANFTIQAQNETGTTSIGGDLILSPGTGTSTNGTLSMINLGALSINGATALTSGSASATGGVAIPATCEEYLVITFRGQTRKIALFAS